MPLCVMKRRPMQHQNRIVLHVAGNDRPGVTARLAQIIAAENATLVDVGQSVLHGYLMWSAIVDIPENSNALRQLLFAVSELGLRLEVSAFKPQQGDPPEVGPGLCVTALGQLGEGVAVAKIASFMAERQMNIREIRSLSTGELSGLELIGELPPGTGNNGALAALRGQVLELGIELGIDLAVQKDDVFRRNKRLVCMDVDSTFVQGELIDELAELQGIKPQVAEITARAMRGELDFRAALTERVKLLEGLPMEKALTLAEKTRLTPGAEHFVRTLKGMGYRVGLVSGGFDFFVDKLKERHGLDFAFSNELEVQGGLLTGRVQGSVVDPERKAQVLKDMAKVYGVRMEQTVAIGDGANDMLMLQSAGLGIAFHAKPKLQQVADMSLNHNARLDTLLFLMGFTARDLRIME
jgi:phosphoserine phosphatase